MSKHYPRFLPSSGLLLLTMLVFGIASSTCLSANNTHGSESIEAGSTEMPARSADAPRLRDALVAALKRHPLTAVAEFEQKLGTAYGSQADALFAGDLAYSLGYRSDQLGDNQGYREFEGSLDFPLWMSGQKDARQSLANTVLSRAKAEQQLLVWEISGEVLEQAWRLRIAEMEVTQARARQQSAMALEKDVERRVEAGELARVDLLTAQQNTAETVLDFENAVAETDLALTAWRALTGLTQLPSDLLQRSQSEAPGHELHPHFVVATARIAAARARQESIYKQRSANPTLSLYAKRDRSTETAPYNESLGVGVSMPFGSKRSRIVSNAEIDLEIANLLAAEAEREREHELETRQARLTLENVRKKVKLVEQQNSLAENRWGLAKRSFELGESDLFQLLRAREQADIQKRELKHSQLKLSQSRARLNHILGALPQ